MGCTLSGHSVVQVPNGQYTNDIGSGGGAFLNYCKFALPNNKTYPNEAETDKKNSETLKDNTGHIETEWTTTSSSGDHSTFVNCTDKGNDLTTTDASLIGGGGSVLLVGGDGDGSDDCHFDPSSMDMMNRGGVGGASNSVFPAIVSNSRDSAMTLSRTCRSSGNSGYVTLPAIVNRGHSESTTSPKRIKDIATRIQSPHVKTIRMHLERQYSDSTSNRTVYLPPFQSNKLRKSFSCNDSWLTEINDYDVWDEEDHGGHLPAIKEVEVTNDDVVTQNDTVSVKMKFPYRTTPSRSCWLTSPPSVSSSSLLPVPKRHRDRSPSMDVSRLPVILEDTDITNGTATVNREENEDTIEASSEFMDPQVGRLDVKDDDVSTTEFSVRMYVASMTELLGLDNIDPRDVPLLNNISIDPSSPLLVQYTNPSPSSQSKRGNSLEVQKPTINANSITKIKQQHQFLEETSNNKNDNNNDRKHMNGHKQQDNVATVIKSVFSNNQCDYINHVPSHGDNG